mmetsp:Transcript_26486/g.55979  ORF Transcript_26486/g.55979 Transcript_26486/m.55979 type:complete len:80 (-) Transcript_26486:618-857(-)
MLFFLRICPKFHFMPRALTPGPEGRFVHLAFHEEDPSFSSQRFAQRQQRRGGFNFSPNSSRRILPDVEKLPHLFRPSTV